MAEYEPIEFVDQPNPLKGNPDAPRLNAANLAHMQSQYAQVQAEVEGGAGPIGTALNAAYVSWPAAANVVAGFQPVRVERAIPAVMADPPTVTKTSTGGDPSPITSGVLIDWDSSLVTVLGAGPITSYLQSGNTYAEVKNGLDGGTPVSEIEFDYYGEDFALRYHHRNTAVRIWVFVDGEPITATPDTPAGSASGFPKWYQVTFDAPGWRRIRVMYDGGIAFSGVSIGPTDAVRPTVAAAPKIAVLGDSWVANTAGGQDSSLGYFPQAGRMLGVQMALFGQGGTGYITEPVTPASRAPYTQEERIQSVIDSAPDYVMIVGSINDADSDDVTTAAETVLAEVKAGLPGVPIIIHSVQQVGESVPAGRIANRNRLAAVADEDSAVVAFLDPIADVVLTGTGRVGSETGTGTADIAVASDGSHLTTVGNGIYARWLVSKLVQVLTST